MIDLNEHFETLRGYSDEFVKGRAENAIRKAFKEVEFLEAERDSYRGRAIELAKINATLLVEVESQKQPIYARLDPVSVQILVDAVTSKTEDKKEDKK